MANLLELAFSQKMFKETNLHHCVPMVDFVNELAGDNGLHKSPKDRRVVTINLMRIYTEKEKES